MGTAPTHPEAHCHFHTFKCVQRLAQEQAFSSSSSTLKADRTAALAGTDTLQAITCLLANKNAVSTWKTTQFSEKQPTSPGSPYKSLRAQRWLDEASWSLEDQRLLPVADAMRWNGEVLTARNHQATWWTRKLMGQDQGCFFFNVQYKNKNGRACYQLVPRKNVSCLLLLFQEAAADTPTVLILFHTFPPVLKQLRYYPNQEKKGQLDPRLSRPRSSSQS